MEMFRISPRSVLIEKGIGRMYCQIWAIRYDNGNIAYDKPELLTDKERDLVAEFYE